MTYQRYQRVSSLILAELNKILFKELEFPDALVTVTGVEVQKDLDFAAVKVSVIPDSKEAEALKILRANRRQLQHLLLKKLNIKPMPEIRFEIDKGLAKAAEVEKVFIDIEKKEDAG